MAVLTPVGAVPETFGDPIVASVVPIDGAASVSVSGSAALGIQEAMTGSASFVVSATARMNRPVLFVSSPSGPIVRVTARGFLSVQAVLVPPPAETPNVSIKRVSQIMPTPVLDANGRPT